VAKQKSRKSDELIKFAVQYLSSKVELDPRSPQAGRAQEGMVIVFVFAKSAEDAILQVRDVIDENSEFPIIRIVAVQPTQEYFGQYILPECEKCGSGEVPDNVTSLLEH